MTQRELLKAVIDLRAVDGIRINHAVRCGYASRLQSHRDTDNCPGCRSADLLEAIEAELAAPEPDARVYIHRDSSAGEWIVMRDGVQVMTCLNYTAKDVLATVCQMLDVAESQVVFV